ncbi:Pol protein [Phytophthora palmivora]|uniref:Pol protein n=1 Tax=Phytophthora palmivora TaxID=4796 RepID=A0A2P4WZY6_9STRA|nr:Pol protein [Phytophthora palmivora]
MTRETPALGVCLPLSKMVHLAPIRDKVTGKQAAQLFLDSVLRYHGLPDTIVSDRDPPFTGEFWDTLFQLLETKLTMSTAYHPQTERVKRVLEDTLRSICAEAPQSWSDQLPVVVFALNHINGVYPVLLEWVKTPPGVVNLAERHRCFHQALKPFSSQVSEIEPGPLKRQLSSFLEDRLTSISPVRDAMASAQDKQKEYSDRKGR